MLNPRPIDVNGLNDGFDDALCLSLSWTEKVIQSIVEFESDMDKKPSNQGVLPIPFDNLTALMKGFNYKQEQCEHYNKQHTAPCFQFQLLQYSVL